MILKWFSQANNVTAETLRSWIRPNGGWWFTDDIESVMNSYQVPYERKNFNEISQLIESLNKNRIVLVCLDGYYLSDDYTSVGSGHFVIIKGYINQNGMISFETYNPDSRKDFQSLSGMVAILLRNRLLKTETPRFSKTTFLGRLTAQTEVCSTSIRGKLR